MEQPVNPPDTNADAPAPAGPVLGYGRCKACDCRGFKATGKQNDVCADCGHYWQIHGPPP